MRIISGNSSVMPLKVSLSYWFFWAMRLLILNGVVLHLSLWIDRGAFWFFGEMGQLVVAMFLFYSGYGVMKSLKEKGHQYLDTYPKNRLLMTLVHFDFAVACFIVLALMMGRELGLSQILLSLIAWDSVGNSNWYIFIILCCYLSFFLVFKAVRTRYLLGGCLLLSFLFVGMLVLHGIKQPYWYNTMLVFPAGVFYAIYEREAERFIQKRYGLTLITLFAIVLIIHFLGKYHPGHGLTHNVKAIIFSLLIVGLTMKVKIGNPWLYWFGLSLFPLYIYQRLPMITFRWLAGEEWVSHHPHLFIGGCFLVTVGIAMLYMEISKRCRKLSA